jgi:hypothetical protein
MVDREASVATRRRRPTAEVSVGRRLTWSVDRGASAAAAIGHRAGGVPFAGRQRPAWGAKPGEPGWESGMQ